MKIKDRDQLNSAMERLAKLSSLSAEVDSECDQKLQEIKATYATRKVVKESGLTFEEEGEQLREAIEEYCDANRKTLIVEGQKSLRLTHGTIGWHKGKDTIKAAKKKDTEKKMLERLIELFMAGLQLLLTKCKVSENIKTSDAITVSFAWNKAGLIKSLNDKKITPDDLKPFGFKFVPGEDAFYCDIEHPKIEGQKTGAKPPG